MFFIPISLFINWSNFILNSYLYYIILYIINYFELDLELDFKFKIPRDLYFMLLKFFHIIDEIINFD